VTIASAWASHSPTTPFAHDYRDRLGKPFAHERLATGYGSECVRVRQDLGVAESQLRDYRERLGKPFAHDAYLSELTSLRDQLKAGLSATAHDASDEDGPTVSELAARVKALKAANTIEATPQRVQRKHAAAEEPITARIRKRQEADSASDHPAEQQVSPQPSAPQPPAGGEDSSAGQPMTFQEQIATERQRQDHEPSLP
jgi:hypothetical protein